MQGWGEVQPLCETQILLHGLAKEHFVKPLSANQVHLLMTAFCFYFHSYTARHSFLESLLCCDSWKWCEHPPFAFYSETKTVSPGSLLSCRGEDLCQPSSKTTFHFVATSLMAKVYSYLCVVRGNESSAAEVESEPSACTRACAALMDVGENTVKWWRRETPPPCDTPYFYSQLRHSRECFQRQQKPQCDVGTESQGEKK